MLSGLSMRDEEYFYVPSPELRPAEPRQVGALADGRIAAEVPGGALIAASTSTGAEALLELRLVGSGEALHCRLRAENAPADKRLVLARDVPPSAVAREVNTGNLRIVGIKRTVNVELGPVRVSVTSGELTLEQDRSTEDASNRLVALPLGFTRLASGGLAYHDSFVAEPDEHFWGLGERFTGFNKRGQMVSCWNHDALGTQSAQSYKNVPFMISSRGYGCFVDTTTNVHFDCCHLSQAFWSIMVPDEQLDYYLVFGTPSDCLAQYQELVGGPDLPPAWALGTWVSTGFLPSSDEDTRALVHRLEAEDIPCDVLHFDSYWQSFGCWSDLRWDVERFPDPAAMLAEVNAADLRASLWINSYIGIESPLFAVAKEAGYFLRRRDGSTYVGKLWGHYHPPVAVIDVTNPEACAWWGAQLADRIIQGATVFKTDFGEAIPTDVLAHNGLSGERLHNAYSLIYNDLVTSVMRGAGIDRPVVWGRSSWAGGQRHVGQWAGDSNSTWQDLASTLRAGLSMALSGHAFWSHDIGGFHGRPSAELYVRWAQFGLLSPMSRFHGTSTRLPWDYGSEALRAVRSIAKLRYALHPYLYAAAADAVRDAVPIMRPMVYDYPEDPGAQAADLQYLLGGDLLVAPFFRAGGRRPVWFPPGEWVHYADGSSVRGPCSRNVELGLQHAPLWLRSASAILLTPPDRRIGEGRYRALTLALVGTDTSGPPAGRVHMPSIGELPLTIEPSGSDRLAITVPEGAPPLDLISVGAAPSFEISINGRPTPPLRQSSLLLGPLLHPPRNTQAR